jgi:prepilin-type N-terminal cleavage/methylation domain-containing protein
MRTVPGRGRFGRASAGFTMIELLVVVGIIAVAAAVALPNIAGFVRSARIRGAAQEVKAQITTARAKAIMKNANLGVVFVALTDTTYRYVIEDDMTGPPFDPRRETVEDLLALPEPNPQAGPPMQLPQGVRFVAGTDPGFRLDRLGRWHDPGDALDPMTDNPLIVAGQSGNFVTNNRNDANCPGTSIRIDQPETGLQRVVCVSTGGRASVCEPGDPCF